MDYQTESSVVIITYENANIIKARSVLVLVLVVVVEDLQL